MRKIAVVGALALAGCASSSVTTPLAATNPTPPERVLYTAPPDATATLVVKREAWPSLPWGVSYRIFLDGKVVAIVAHSESVKLPVRAGEHIVGVGDTTGDHPMMTSVALAEPGGTYYFRVSNDSMGDRHLNRASTADE